MGAIPTNHYFLTSRIKATKIMIIAILIWFVSSYLDLHLVIAIKIPSILLASIYSFLVPLIAIILQMAWLSYLNFNWVVIAAVVTIVIMATGCLLLAAAFSQVAIAIIIVVIMIVLMVMMLEINRFSFLHLV